MAAQRRRAFNWINKNSNRHTMTSEQILQPVCRHYQDRKRRWSRWRAGKPWTINSGLARRTSLKVKDSVFFLFGFSTRSLHCFVPQQQFFPEFTRTLLPKILLLSFPIKPGFITISSRHNFPLVAKMRSGCTRPAIPCLFRVRLNGSAFLPDQFFSIIAKLAPAAFWRRR
jgi:hypothetical protein